MPNLIFERGREKGTSFELKADAPCVAGRDPAAAQIVISDPAASRRHFQIGARDGKWFVTDLGSRNATFLNEEKLEKDKETELSSGDRVQVGETVLSFLDDEKSDADKSAAQGLNGKEIGGYKILERIGRGGMGTVFKAKQISLNRVVALKVLSSKFAKDPKFVEKFNSEARAAGQLNHPNVVQVFDVGQSGGLHYFSMEFMEGGCVQDMLSAAPEGRLTWQEAMPLILDAARGLVFAEKRGIIHRDIKPDNLMLTSEQRVKIGDLGLAKKAEEGGDKQIFGTPHFIAPEQAQGKDVTHAADLYAMGASFYRIVVGKTPFSGETVKEILRKQIHEAPQPITQAVPDFPEDLEAIVAKLMAKKVEDRYQTATKLVEDLEAFQLAHQIELSGARKLNKPLVAALALITLAAAGVGVYYAFIKAPEVRTETIEKEKIVEVPGNTGPTLTPEQEAQLVAGKAKDAYYAIRDRDPRGKEIELDREAELLAIADEYDKLQESHPDPRAAEAIKPALERAKEIRETLKEKKVQAAQQVEMSKRLWGDWKRILDEHEAAGRWSEAIRTSEKFVKDARAPEVFKVVPEARRHLEKSPERVVAAAEHELNETLQKADEQFKAGEGEAAIKSINDWATAIEENPANERFKGFAEQARRQSLTMREMRNEQLLGVIEADKVTYVLAVRGLRQGGSESMGLVFDLDFEGAAAQFEKAAADLKSWPYKTRAAALAARLRSAQKAWTDWVQLLADGKLFATSDELHGLTGGRAGDTYKLRLDDKPTVEKFTMDKILGSGAGKQKQVTEWSALSREELANVFVLPKTDKLKADVALGLSWLFVSLDHGPAALALLDRAIAVGAQIAPEEEIALRREISTINDWDELRRKTQMGAEPAEIIGFADVWRRKYAGTDAFVLHDGRPERDASLFVASPDTIDKFLKSPDGPPAAVPPEQPPDVPKKQAPGDQDGKKPPK